MSLDEKLGMAAQAHLSRRYDESEALSREILIEDPSNLRAKLLLGMALCVRGQVAQAIPVLEEVHKAEPRQFESLIHLAMCYGKFGNPGKSLEYAEAACMIQPNNGFAQNILGQARLGCGQPELAEGSFLRALAISPNVAELHAWLGQAVELQNKHEEALAQFSKAIELNPRKAANHVALSRLYFILGRDEEAEGSALRAIELAPQDPFAHLALGQAQFHTGKVAQALAATEKVISLMPTNQYAHSLLGQIKLSEGDVEGAGESFRRSIEVQPIQGLAYFSLLHSRRATANEVPMLGRMESLVQSRALPPGEMESLHYGLGKAYEDLGRYEEAMKNYDAANRLAYKLKFADAKMDQTSYRAGMSRIIEFFSAERLNEPEPAADPTEYPVFVVGMLRSGTTLAEKILSSHPDVVGMGEVDFWAPNLNKAFDPAKNEIRSESLRALIKGYLKILREKEPASKRAVDKMPANILAVGLLHIAFPNARIIHMRRNPLDTCISVFATPNRSRTDSLHNKENIAFAYEEYLRLAAHWRSVMPASRFLEVRYEDMVSTRERVSRRMVEFCGLKWDENVLRPEETEAIVRTPSAWQVRQPIYSTSVDRWKRFEPWLGPFERLKSLPS